MSTESKHGSEHLKASLPDDESPGLTDEELGEASGGDRRGHDHVGNFNFKVEIEGVTQDAIQPTDDTSFKVRRPD